MAREASNDDVNEHRLRWNDAVVMATRQTLAAAVVRRSLTMNLATLFGNQLLSSPLRRRVALLFPLLFLEKFHFLNTRQIIFEKKKKGGPQLTETGTKNTVVNRSTEVLNIFTLF